MLTASVEQLDKELASQRLAAAAFQRAGFNSMFPALADNAGYLLGTDPLFDTRVTGTPTQGVTSFPLVNLVDDTAKAARGLAQVATQGKEFYAKLYRKVLSLHPFQNTLPMFWLHNNVGGSFPQGN